MPRLAGLASAEPQTVLIEGGSQNERLAAALYLAAALICVENGPPCAQCLPCRRVLAGAGPDLVLLDGSKVLIPIGDAESPEPGTIRHTRRMCGESPHGRNRVVVLHEAYNMRAEGANALLKTLEEPRPGNAFVLTAPSRDRLLPTLASRSLVLTLAWASRHRPVQEAGDFALAAAMDEDDEKAAAKEKAFDEEAWLRLMEEFLQSGQGLMAKTSAKTAIDRAGVLRLLTLYGRALAEAMSGRPRTNLGRLLARLPKARLMELDAGHAEAETALGFQAQPTLVLDVTLTKARLFLAGR